MSTDLFNVLLAGLGNPTRAFHDMNFSGKDDKKHSKATALLTRQKLIGAQKFQVCNSLLGHAVHASMAKPTTLLDMFGCAIPPFQNMWLEWDEHTRMTLMFDRAEAMGWPAGEVPDPDSWPASVGYHIRCQNDTDGLYAIDQYFMDEGKLCTPPFSVQFSPLNKIDLRVSVAERTLDVSGKNVVGQTPHEQLVDKQLSDGPSLIGPTYVSNYLTNSVVAPKVLQDIYERTSFCLNQTHTVGLHGAFLSRDQNKLAKIQNAALLMWSGDLRFIISVLALLNYEQKVKERTLEKGPTRIMFGARVPRNELKVLEIDLPKPRGTTRYERMFKGGGGKKRRHVRRGHFHTFIYKDGSRVKKWLEEKWVGDEALGTIIHDYQLKSKGSK